MTRIEPAISPRNDARNLAKAGFDVIVYNRSRDDTDALLGDVPQL